MIAWSIFQEVFFVIYIEGEDNDAQKYLGLLQEIILQTLMYVTITL